MLGAVSAFSALFFSGFDAGYGGSNFAKMMILLGVGGIFVDWISERFVGLVLLAKAPTWIVLLSSVIAIITALTTYALGYFVGKQIKESRR